MITKVYSFNSSLSLGSKELIKTTNEIIKNIFNDINY